MTTWLYHSSIGNVTDDVMSTSANVETVGARQLELLLRARKSPSGLVITDDSDAERSAAWRLKQRGLLTPPVRLGRRGTSVWLTCWTLTPRGRRCWLRVRKEES